MNLKEKISINFNPGTLIDIRRVFSLKSISIIIEKNIIVIKAPFILNNKLIEEFIIKKKKWIIKQLEIRSKIQLFEKKNFIDGENFLYLGKNYKLKILINNKNSIYIKGSHLIVNVKNHKNLSKIQKIIKEWLFEKSFKYFKEKTYSMARNNNLKVKSVEIRAYKARWGSCSINGDILFNWRLIMAPPKIIEYVIVHELMHIKEHNHSPKYWEHVKILYPDIKNAKEWLMYKGQTLNI